MSMWTDEQMLNMGKAVGDLRGQVRILEQIIAAILEHMGMIAVDQPARKVLVPVDCLAPTAVERLREEGTA